MYITDYQDKKYLSLKEFNAHGIYAHTSKYTNFNLQVFLGEVGDILEVKSENYITLVSGKSKSVYYLVSDFLFYLEEEYITKIKSFKTNEQRNEITKIFLDFLLKLDENKTRGEKDFLENLKKSKSNFERQGLF